jgi:hypothetical protein
MKALIQQVTRTLASNLHPAQQGSHHHPSSAGPYICTDPDCHRVRIRAPRIAD